MSDKLAKETYAKAKSLQVEVTKSYDALLEKYDLLILPTVAHLAERMPDLSNPVSILESAHTNAQNTAAFNTTGDDCIVVSFLTKKYRSSSIEPANWKGKRWKTDWNDDRWKKMGREYHLQMRLCCGERDWHDMISFQQRITTFSNKFIRRFIFPSMKSLICRVKGNIHNYPSKRE